jgi:hypothetical protein
MPVPVLSPEHRDIQQLHKPLSLDRTGHLWVLTRQQLIALHRWYM